MTREIAHQQSFEKALDSIQPNFPPGKLPGKPEFANVYFNMSSGDGDARGPWNNEPRSSSARPRSRSTVAAGCPSWT